MIKVKEIINYQDTQEKAINDWLESNKDKINKIIDIKYSVSAFQETRGRMPAQEFSGVLIVYDEKEESNNQNINLIKEYIQNNLQIEIKKESRAIFELLRVSLELEGEEISSDLIKIDEIVNRG